VIGIGLVRRDAETGSSADVRLVEFFQASFGHMKVL
jgi:hypothetical protein